MKNVLFLFVCLLFAASDSSGQASLRVFSYRPLGEFGLVMKPKFSAEIGWQSRFSRRSTKRVRYGFSLMYLDMQPREEVFLTYGELYDDNGLTIIPILQSFQRYSIFQINAGGDFAFVHRQKLNVFAGADMVAGAAAVAYTSYAPGVRYESYDGGGILGGGRFRLGVEYAIRKRLSVFFNAHRSVVLLVEPKTLLKSNDFGLGVRYSFN